MPLSDLINNTFADTVYPGDDNIVPKTQYDDETRATEAELIGRHWNAINPLDSDFHPLFDLVFLTPEAYHFYIPAFLIAALKQDCYQAQDVILMTFESLSPPSKKTLYENYFLPRTSLFTPEQGAVILLFIKFVIVAHPELFQIKTRTGRVQSTIDFWQAHSSSSMGT